MSRCLVTSVVMMMIMLMIMMLMMMQMMMMMTRRSMIRMKDITCKVRGGKVAAKISAEIFGLLETLGFVIHQVAGTICIAGIVPENRFHVVFWINH